MTCKTLIHTFWSFAKGWITALHVKASVTQVTKQHIVLKIKFLSPLTYITSRLKTGWFFLLSNLISFDKHGKINFIIIFMLEKISNIIQNKN